MHNDLQADPNFLNRLTNGGKVLTTLRHENLVSVYDTAVSRTGEARETTTFIVMDYIEGYTLRDYIKATSQRGIFPSTADIVYLFSCLGTAVDYIHQQGITHGNIKPSNILLHKQQRANFAAGEPMLTDVGLTQIAGNDSYLSAPHYLSPEQAQSKPANKASDIYTLGVILYELCTGTVPFRGDNTYAVISQHINTLPAPPTLLNANIPQALAQVILRALAKDPATRFPEATLLAYAIAEACAVQPTHPQVKQIATRRMQTQQTNNPATNNSQSILGVSQPLTPESPIFMRPLPDLSTRQQAVPGPTQPVSLNANPNVSASAVFPNSGPLSSVSISKNTGPISASRPAVSPTHLVPGEPKEMEILPPLPPPRPSALSGPLSNPGNKQFLNRQAAPNTPSMEGSNAGAGFAPLPSTPSAPRFNPSQPSPEPTRPYQQSPMPEMQTPQQPQPAVQQLNTSAQPLTFRPTTPIYKNKYAAIALVLLIAIIVATIGITTLINHSNAGQPAVSRTTQPPLPPVVSQGPGTIFFRMMPWGIMINCALRCKILLIPHKVKAIMPGCKPISRPSFR
ncbi:hypothetical protein KDK_16470 [Dictyobacter kobayashii]|uniref:non-specific serine/threonine protein kinase n=1 Tax=Dictyobacter kobayashii TaxID=2014872 RepID=A0A402AFF0_9CHLR|nr:hypothetical protein KDK_16470 [Dictyobacter kobayashii]